MTMVPIYLVSAASVLVFGLAAYWLMAHQPVGDQPFRIHEAQPSHIKPGWAEALLDEERYFASKGY